MKCPKCGAENVDDAEFCSLCLERLRAPRGGAYPSPGTGVTHGAGPYIAPGEWRGDAETLSPTVSKVVETKVKRFRWKMVVYGAIIVLVVVWIILSFTLWGEPSPGEQANSLIDAINNRDRAGFVALVVPDNKAGGEQMYDEIVRKLGEDGRYVDVVFNVETLDNYDAKAYVTGGMISFETRTSRALDSEDNLIISLENHKGTWYVNPRNTLILPRIL